MIVKIYVITKLLSLKWFVSMTVATWHN